MGLPDQKCLSGVGTNWPKWHFRVGQMSGQSGAEGWGRPGKGQARTPMGASLWWSRVASCCAWLSPVGWYLLILFYLVQWAITVTAQFSIQCQRSFRLLLKCSLNGERIRLPKSQLLVDSELLNLKLEGLFLANSYFCNLKIPFVLCPQLRNQANF